MHNSTKSAAHFAVRRAGSVLYGALIGIFIWILVILMGPRVEAAIDPVITDYQLTDVMRTKDGVSFIPFFEKTRSGYYQGSAWEIINPTGANIRVQAQLPDRDTPPETGPVGLRVGTRIFLPLPPGRQCFAGTYFHDTGLFWQSQSPIGPFCVTEEGKVTNAAH